MLTAGSVSTRRGIPMNKTSSIIAVLAAGAGAAAWLDFPPLLRAPLGFFLAGVLPGWILARLLWGGADTTADALAMGALVLSVPAGIVLRLAGFLTGLSGSSFALVLAALCIAGAVLLPGKRKTPAPADRVAWVVALGLGVIAALPAAVNPVFRTWGDAMFHSQLVYALLNRGVPPGHPAYAGFPATYMWLFHVWIAGLTETMGVSPYAVFPWVNAGMMAAVAFGIHRLTSTYWPDRLTARLSPLVVVLGMNALGWLTLLLHMAVDPFLGADRGAVTFTRRYGTWWSSPPYTTLRSPSSTGDFHVCSFPFRISIPTLSSASPSLPSSDRIVSGAGEPAGAALCLATAGAVVVHPIVGGPVAGALLVGLSWPPFRRGAGAPWSSSPPSRGTRRRTLACR